MTPLVPETADPFADLARHLKVKQNVDAGD